MFKRNSKAIGIDVSPSSIKIVEAFKRKGNIIVQGAQVIEYPASLYQMAKDEQNKEMQKILRGTLAQKNLKGCKVCVGLSGQSTFLRFIDLPHTDRKKIQRIIRYEALQQIPFPLDEVIWNYACLRGQGLGTAKAIIAVVKKDIVNSFLKIFSDIEVDFVDVSPLALYNVVRFFHDFDKRIILDIGSESTEILIISKGRLWKRTVLIGGNDITRSLSCEMNIGFAEAEKLKVDRGTVITHPQQRLYPAQELKISQAITSILFDLLKEVSQSIGYYKSQYQETEIFDKILLTGGTSALVGIDKFFGQHLMVGVERLDVFKNGNGANLEKLSQAKQDRLGVAFGLALKGLARDTAVNINLLPEELFLAKKFKQRKQWLRNLSYAIIILSMLGSLFISQRTVTYKKELSEIENTISKYESDEKIVKTYLSDIGLIENKFAIMKNIAFSRRRWLTILLAINESLPANMWIDQIKSEGSSVLINAQSNGKSLAIAEFKKNLEKIKYFASVEVPSEKTEGRGGFSLKIALKKEYE